MADLVILGGGASGLMAAVSAARFIPGKNISILERGPRVGKKLLVTGNGRCNLTNLELDFSRYHGAPESFVSAVFSQLPPKDTLSLFGRLGLLCREESQGRCYPYGGQASAVLDVLRRYLEGRNVEERCQTSVETVKRKPGGYELKTSGGVVFAKRLILASGGRAMPSSGSDGSGLKLTASLGLKASEPFPSLAPVRAASPVLKAVKGLRCRGRASLLADRKTVKQETGEIQFTDQGLSGICILNLSRLVGEFFSHRTVNRHKTEKVELSLDLVPDLDYSSLLSFLQALISGQPGYVTRYGVVYDNGIKLDQAYDRKHLPPIWMTENSILELKIRATGEDDPKKQEWVQLPASRIKLERAMLRAGIPSCGEMQMLVSDSRFPDEVDCALDFEQESLFELNQLCRACSNFKEQDLEKLGAVCQMAKPTCAANIRQLAVNLDQFDFAPNAHTPEELGRYMIQRSGHYEYDENLEAFYNYGDYGVKRMLQEDGVFVDRGYVSYHGTLTLDELMRDDPAEGYQQEQEAKMEGMTW